MALARPGAQPADKWNIQAISVPKAPGTDKFSHGLGVGDVNGDGRSDVISTGGWWEQPEKPDGKKTSPGTAVVALPARA